MKKILRAWRAWQKHHRHADWDRIPAHCPDDQYMTPHHPQQRHQHRRPARRFRKSPVDSSHHDQISHDRAILQENPVQVCSEEKVAHRLDWAGEQIQPV